MATIIARDLDKIIVAYTSELGYKTLYDGKVSEDQAEYWNASELDGCKFIILGPESGAPVYIRIIHLPDVAKAEPKAGWFAIELCVKDVEALHEKLESSSYFKPFAPPKMLPFTDKVYPMQCRGASGEILYLNQTRGNLPDIHLPLAQCDVDHIFISILCAGDMEHSLKSYAALLENDINERHEIPYKTINRVFGLPLDTVHKLATLGRPRNVTLEINQAPVPSDAGSKLQEGIWMVSFVVENFNLDAQSWRLDELPYNGVESQFHIGPDGERIELIKL